MHLKINDINKFLLYNCRASWVSKWALDKLLEIARIINSTPEEFNWTNFFDELNENFVLDQRTVKWFENIKIFLQKKVVLDAYISGAKNLNEIKFIGVIKLQILLLHLTDCEYIGKDKEKTVYYNLDDINSINKIFETCLIEDWYSFEQTFNKYLANLWSVEFENLDKITGKNVSDDLVLEAEFKEFIKELKELNKIKNNSNIKECFLKYFQTKYKYVLIGVEKLLYNKNENSLDEKEYSNS